MAVQREHFNRSDLQQITGKSMPVVERLERHAAGGWTFHFRLAGEVTLPDGRAVVVNRRVAVRATEQVGRKRRARVA